jgi:hypothetical protein
MQYESKGVVALVWIPPWALAAFDRCNYIELDTSFRAIKPYVYSIPLAIHANEAFPLAIIVGLSESLELYKMFFRAMESIGITREVIIKKPFLTDQHKALKAACAGCTHFFCYRHLIKNFGSRSFIGQIVRRLAFSSTPAEFISQIMVTIQDLEVLQEKNQLDHKQIKRLFKRFGTVGANGEMSFNVETWISQSIWFRALYGVSTCSNHIEGFHRAINKATARYLLLTRRLRKIFKMMIQRYESACLYQHTQGTKLLKKLVKQQKSLNLKRCEECHDERCGWKNYFTALMSTDFPCIHEAGSRPVDWFQTDETELEYLIDDSFEAIEYTGEWDIPHSDDADPISMNSLENEWHRDSETRSAFIADLAREVTSICGKHIVYPQLVATLGAHYFAFIGGEDESQAARSNFRVEWWIKAQTGDIEIR